MRKEDLSIEIDYAYWNGSGQLSVPRDYSKAKYAIRRVQRVRVIAVDQEADTTDWLIPPRTTGVLYYILDPESGEYTYSDDKIVTGWTSTARNFAMPWDKFRDIVDPIVERHKKEKERQDFLLGVSDQAKALASHILGVDESIVEGEASEYKSYGGDRLIQYAEIHVRFNSIEELQSWIFAHEMKSEVKK